MYKHALKRLLDLILSFIGLLLLSPIFIVITLGLLLSNRGKPFFIQPRPGKNGVIFKIIKFKTMNDLKDIHGNLLPDADRLTPIGNLVRKSSLDEIPQLINVFIGDMSLIGPRPLLIDYLPLYDSIQKQRHNVRPGITGWAQVNGRNAISWHQKFEFDVWYVQHLSFNLDVKIFFMTLKKVFKREGISGDGIVTAERFKGN